MGHEQEVIAALTEIAVVKENSEFLSRLRDMVTDPRFDLTQLAGDIDERTLGALYFLTVFVNDIWVNLAIDTSFEFPASDPRLVGLTNKLRLFVLELCKVAEQNKEAFTEALIYLCGALKEYYTFTQDTMRRLREGISSEEGSK